MNGKPVTTEDIKKIIHLRKTGHSLPEIMKITKKGSSTVFKHIQKVEVLPQFVFTLRIKQGGSRARSDTRWRNANKKAKEILPAHPSLIQRMYLLSGLYWGEGNKRELNLINSDPALIKTFITCLNDLGVNKKDIRITLRIHQEIDVENTISFWSDYLNISRHEIRNVNIIHGNKVGRLKYGMCRVRIAKSAEYFKLLASFINEIKRQFNAPVVQWIE